MPNIASESRHKVRAVVQRTKWASVAVGGRKKAEIGLGLLILLGIECGDTEEEAQWLSQKTAGLRIFDDKDGVMNLSVKDVDGEAIVISQFTLMASYKKGNRPSYLRAAGHEEAIPLYNLFCEELSELLGKPVGTGEFGADMKVELLNDGPVTICMNTKNKE